MPLSPKQKKALAWTLLFSGGTVSLVALVFFLWFTWTLPSVKSLRSFKPPASSEVFSEEYIKIGEFFHPERRVFLGLHQTPPLMVKAFIAAEDSDFFKHRGISFIGILRAFLKNMLAGQVKQGGSTITQQVAKSLLLSPERTFVRKARELLLALKMERFLSKEQILEIYLNQVYLGNGAYGIQAAAQTYFRKDVAGLTVAQMALLGGITKAPSRDNPHTDPVRALNRRNYVIKRMYEEEYITKADAESAMAEPIAVKKESDLNLEFAPYFVEHLRRYVMEKYGDDLVYRGGLQIYTTARAVDALAANKALRKGLEDLDRRQGYRGPIEHLNEEDRASFLSKLKTSQPSLPVLIDSNLKALVLDVRDRDGKVLVDVGFTSGTITIESMKWARVPNPDRYWENDFIDRPSKALRVGDVIWVRYASEEKGETFFTLSQIPEAQGALVSLDPRNGSIRSMVGGYDYEKSEYNRAVQAKRQPGSAFKPLIYTTALDHGFTPASIIMDSPIVYDDPSKDSAWKPKNFEGDFQGPTIFRDCLIKSRNVPTVKILQQIGIPPVIQYAKRLGITSDLAEDYSLALGSSSISPLELANVYSEFASLGRKVTPFSIKKIVDRGGKVLEQNDWDDPGASLDDQAKVLIDQTSDQDALTKATELGKDLKNPLPENFVLTPQTAYMITHLLKDVIRSGTGTKAQALNRPAAGKTGTTNDNFDVWFVGFTPSLVAVVWIGFDQGRSLGAREMGGHAATPVWVDYMQEALAGRPVLDFQVPDGIAFAQIDQKTGKLKRKLLKISF